MLSLTDYSTGEITSAGMILQLKTLCNERHLSRLSSKKAAEQKKLALSPVDEYGKSLLHLAVLKNDFEVIKAYKEAGGDLDIIDKLGRTATYYAVINNKWDIVKYLASSGANLNTAGGPSASSAAYRLLYSIRDAEKDGYEDVVETILDDYLAKPENKISLLKEFIKNGDKIKHILHPTVRGILKTIVAEVEEADMLIKLRLLNEDPVSPTSSTSAHSSAASTISDDAPVALAGAGISDDVE